MTKDASELYMAYESWKGWDKLFQYTKDKSDYFSGETRGIKVAGAEVLEIGFGSGDLLQWMIDQGATVVATEINPVLIRAAQERGISVINPEFERIADMHRDRFDTIIAFDVFEHFSFNEIVSKLEAIEKMLKVGGHLLLRFPNAQSPFGLAPQNGDPTHQSPLSKSVFESFVSRKNLEIVRYGHEFRARGQTMASIFARLVKGALRDMISIALNFIYSTDIPYDAVVVIVIRKHQ